MTLGTGSNDPTGEIVVTKFYPCIIIELIVAGLLLGQQCGHTQELRFALIMGNDQYRTAALATSAIDAGY